MASLNTLRTKFGVVLSIVIALALLAFIFSLRAEMGFGNSDPTVGVINGDKIGYMEYLNEYETIKSNNNAGEASEEESDALAATTWQSLIAKHLLIPGFNDVGIEVSQAERLAMLSGEMPSQVFYNTFGNPQTGEYNVEAISSFLAQVSANPQYQSFWTYINEQAVLERLMGKYMGLVKAGTYANSLEVAQGVSSTNESRKGRYVAVNYSTVADSTLKVTNADVQKYYDEHKKLYKKLPHRELSYVVFDVTPTSDDMLEIEKKAAKLGEEFAAAEDIRAFVRKNMGSISQTYASAATLSEEEAVLLEGKQFGPVLKSDEWVISRPIEIKSAPDSLELSHIVLGTQTQLADSLMGVLKGGADFAEVAKKHSEYEATAQIGGDLGVIPFSAMSIEVADQLADAKVGDIVKVTMGGAAQIIKVVKSYGSTKYALVGQVSLPVEPSSATRRDVHNVVSLFSVNGKGSIDTFNAAASEAAVTPRVARVNQGERRITGLESSHEIVRWAYGAKENEISEIFNLGDSYVVAMVTKIDDSEYVNIDDVRNSIAQSLYRKKKFEVLKSKLSGSSIDEIAKSAGAEVAAFENVKFTDYGAGELTFEPRLVGSICSTTEVGKVSAPVEGYQAAIVFVVDDITKEEKQNAEAEKARLQAVKESLSIQGTISAINAMSEIEDLRGKYF